MVGAWPDPTYEEKKKIPTPPNPLRTFKYFYVTRKRFYKEALSTLRNRSGWSGWLAD